MKFLIKSAFLMGILAFLAWAIFLMTNSCYKMIAENVSGIFLMFGLCAAFVWVLTKIITKIACSLSFFYWLFCLGLAIVMYVLSLNSNSFLELFTLNIVGFMFFIPEVAGDWTSYLNTEITFNDYDNVVSATSWISEEYTPGCIKKLFAMIILSLIFAGLSTGVGAGIVLTIEAIYAVILTVVNLKNFFS